MSRSATGRDPGYRLRLAGLLVALATVGALTFLGSRTGHDIVADLFRDDDGGPFGGLSIISGFISLFSWILFVGGGLTIALLLKSLAVSRRSRGAGSPQDSGPTGE